MLPLLMQRVAPRVLAPAVATLGRRPAILARQQLVTRTFLTTLFTSEPAAKSATTKAKKAEDEEGKKPAKKTTSSKTKAKAKAKAKPATKSKPKAKAKAKAKPAVTRNSDLETRLAHGTLKTIKIRKSERPPIRAPTAYSIYVKEQFATSDIQTSGPGAFPNAAKEISARWHALSDAERQVYRDKAASRVADWLKMRDEWYEKADPRLIRALNAQRRAANLSRIHDPRKATRPLPPFLAFYLGVKHTIEVDPTMGPREAVLEQSRKASVMWKALSEEEKEPFISRYKKECEEYKAKEQEA